MKILTVVDPTACNHIHCFVKAIDGNGCIEEVEEAFEELDIHVEPNIVEEIAHDLNYGRKYWYDETFCFEIIHI